MSKNRREFITTASFVACAPMSTLDIEKFGSTEKILHHVFFWLNAPGSDADRRELIRGLQTLKRIRLIKDLIIGIPASTQKRDVIDSSYDVSALMYFDDVESQDEYQVHPKHTEFVEQYKHLWNRVVVYDSLIVK